MRSLNAVIDQLDIRRGQVQLDAIIVEVTADKNSELGVNWIDTAATYGDGRSEESLGRVLQALDLRTKMHVATKVRIPP